MTHEHFPVRTKHGGNLGTASSRAKLKQRREPYWVIVVRGCALGYRKGAKGGTWIAVCAARTESSSITRST